MLHLVLQIYWCYIRIINWELNIMPGNDGLLTLLWVVSCCHKWEFKYLSAVLNCCGEKWTEPGDKDPYGPPLWPWALHSNWKIEIRIQIDRIHIVFFIAFIQIAVLHMLTLLPQSIISLICRVVRLHPHISKLWSQYKPDQFNIWFWRLYNRLRDYIIYPCVIRLWTFTVHLFFHCNCCLCVLHNLHTL